MKAYRIYTGDDGHSHIEVGKLHHNRSVKTKHTHFEETPAEDTLDWHTAPIPQYVITLGGILEFTTRTGETCIVRPGDILLAEDCTGTGHVWELLTEDSWKRVYVIFEEGQDTLFVVD